MTGRSTCTTLPCAPLRGYGQMSIRLFAVATHTCPCTYMNTKRAGSGRIFHGRLGKSRSSVERPQGSSTARGGPRIIAVATPNAM